MFDLRNLEKKQPFDDAQTRRIGPQTANKTSDVPARLIAARLNMSCPTKLISTQKCRFYQ